MKTMVGTGDNPERSDGFKPSGKKRAISKTFPEEQKKKLEPEKPYQSPLDWSKSMYPQPEKNGYIKQQEPKPKKKSIGITPFGINPGSYPQPEKEPNTYTPTIDERIGMAKKIKSTIRGGQWAGRGDNPHYYPDGNYYHG